MKDGFLHTNAMAILFAADSAMCERGATVGVLFTTALQRAARSRSHKLTLRPGPARDARGAHVGPSSSCTKYDCACNVLQRGMSARPCHDSPLYCRGRVLTNSCTRRGWLLKWRETGDDAWRGHHHHDGDPYHRARLNIRTRCSRKCMDVHFVLPEYKNSISSHEDNSAKKIYDRAFCVPCG